MMQAKQVLNIQQALDIIEQISRDDQVTVIEELQKRWSDQRRQEIAQNAANTKLAIREKRAKYGTLADLKQDLK